jgi:hypothetical protein
MYVAAAPWFWLPLLLRVCLAGYWLFERDHRIDGPVHLNTHTRAQTRD